MRYEIHQDLSKEEELLSRDKLTEYNLPFSGHPEFSEIGLALRDQSNMLIGSLYGSIAWSWFHISVLWISENLRGEGYGKELLLQAENIAIARDCEYSKLHTFSFQSRPFYEAQGYKVISETPDFPKGHVQYLMIKQLQHGV